MLIIFQQVFILFLFAASGYVLSKSKIIDSCQSQILSKLLVYLFLPCNIIKTFSTNFTLAYIAGNFEILTTSLVVILVLAITMHFVAKIFSKNAYERHIYEYSLIIPNYGYMGYALAESILGESGLMNLMMFALPVSCYTYTIGFAMLTKRPLSLKKLLNPVVLSMLVGILVGIIQIPLSETIYSVLNKASACMAPVSMLLAGIVISEFDLKKLLYNKVTYIIVILRLVVIPITLGYLLSLVCRTQVVETCVLLYAMPCGLNTIVFPKLVEENCEIGASLAFISNIFACVTIAFVFELIRSF